MKKSYTIEISAGAEEQEIKMPAATKEKRFQWNKGDNLK